MNQLFAKKPLDVLLEEVKGENRLRRVLGPVQLSSLGVGAIIGTGIFVLDRRGRARHGRPGAHALLRGRRPHLHLRGALLRGVRLDGAGRRLGLHLRLRHARRAVRLDHRLGPGARVRGRRRRRWPTAGRSTSRTSSQIFGVHVARRRSPTRRSTTTRRPGDFVSHRQRSSTCRRSLIAARRHRRPGEGHPGERQLQRRDGDRSRWPSCCS